MFAPSQFLLLDITFNGSFCNPEIIFRIKLLQAL